MRAQDSLACKLQFFTLFDTCIQRFYLAEKQIAYGSGTEIVLADKKNNFADKLDTPAKKIVKDDKVFQHCKSRLLSRPFYL